MKEFYVMIHYFVSGKLLQDKLVQCYGESAGDVGICGSPIEASIPQINNRIHDLVKGDEKF